MCSPKRNYTPKTHSPICYHTNYLNIHQKRNPKRSVCGFDLAKSQISSFGKQDIVIPFSSKKCGIIIVSRLFHFYNPLTPQIRSFFLSFGML